MSDLFDVRFVPPGMEATVENEIMLLLNSGRMRSLLRSSYKISLSWSNSGMSKEDSLQEPHTVTTFSASKPGDWAK
jgi:hypothetical protein